MVEISNDTLLLVLVVVSFGISIVLYVQKRQSNTRQDEVKEGSNKVKKRAVSGQEEAVETLKDLSAENIKFTKDIITDLRAEIKRLKGTISYYKTQLYGSGALEEEDLKGTPKPLTKIRPNSNVSEDIVNMRIRMIADKIKIPPELLMFDDVNTALAEIASSPDFEKIASTALNAKTNSTENTSEGKIPGITYV